MTIENSAKYRELETQFMRENGRKPNNLDKLALIEQIKIDQMAVMIDQLDRMEAMLVGMEILLKSVEDRTR